MCLGTICAEYSSIYRWFDDLLYSIMSKLNDVDFIVVFFFFKQKTAYEITR